MRLWRKWIRRKNGLVDNDYRNTEDKRLFAGAHLPLVIIRSGYSPVYSLRKCQDGKKETDGAGKSNPENHPVRHNQALSYAVLLIVGFEVGLPPKSCESNREGLSNVFADQFEHPLCSYRSRITCSTGRVIRANSSSFAFLLPLKSTKFPLWHIKNVPVSASNFLAWLHKKLAIHKNS